MFTLRFDMRTPAGGTAVEDMYAAALEMASWCEDRGVLMVVLSEHHGSDDGYLPSPLVLASAMAARTSNLSISVMVAVLPLYDPIRLAEDMCVIDILSGGRVSYVLGIGYLPREYEMYGVDFTRRGALAEEKLGLLLKAKTGEEFTHDGQTFKMTPAPSSSGGPVVFWGGGSLAAARRAGRHGIGFSAQRGVEGLEQAYEEASEANGHEPGFCFVPPPDMATSVFVSDDLDRAWDELGPYLMQDVQAYGEWNRDVPASASMSRAMSVAELRSESASHRILTVDEAVEMIRGGDLLQLHPLIGGLPPEIAWPYLRTVTDEVMPAVERGVAGT